MYSACIAIADVVFEVRTDRTPEEFHWDPGYSSFFCQQEPDIIVTTRFSDEPPVLPECEDKVSDPDSCWEAYRAQDRLTFVLRGSLPDQGPYCVAELDGNRRRADVRYRSSGGGSPRIEPVVHPLAYPLFHLLMISVMPNLEGILVHASAIADRGKGLLFVGSSGTGKTTLARLWDGQATVLSDERIALRRRDNEWRVYGTPWHGEYEKFAAMGVPLAAIFFLKGSGANAVTGVRPAIAAAQFASHCLMPLWDQDAMGRSLDTLAGLVADVPCYELTFNPDASVVDFLRCVQPD